LRKPSWKRSIKQVLTFDRTAFAGLVLLGASSLSGALLRNAAYLTNYSAGRAHPACDTYPAGLCIPTAYFSIPLGQLGSLVINSTSFLVSASLFVLGVLFVLR
jgi:hypothetical protein